jgi:hypothetical protein
MMYNLHGGEAILVPLVIPAGFRHPNGLGGHEWEVIGIDMGK